LIKKQKNNFTPYIYLQVIPPSVFPNPHLLSIFHPD
jgi:predicted protein tyrosine phosphatase